MHVIGHGILGLFEAELNLIWRNRLVLARQRCRLGQRPRRPIAPEHIERRPSGN